MDKRELKTQLIIDTAFKVWGDNFFYSTSLSSLADALGMTKPALYRYFKNKDAILLAMKDDLIDKYQGLLKKSGAGGDLDALLVAYTENAVRFFAGNYYYYRFFVLKLINMKQDIKLLFKEMMGEDENCLSPHLIM